MVDKPLMAGLKLFIVNISLENVLHTCHYKENKNIQTYTYNLFIILIKYYIFIHVLLLLQSLLQRPHV